MKTLLFIACSTLFIGLIGCKRESETNALQMKRELLTGDTLIYDEAIVNWRLPSQRVVFKKGSTSNTLPLDTSWIKYNLDSTFQAMLFSIRYDGKCEFQDNGGKIRLTSTSLDFDETYNVIKLTKDTFEWHDPSRYSFYRQVMK